MPAQRQAGLKRRRVGASGRPTKTSVLAQRVLADWKAFGAGYASVAAFCRGRGHSYASVRKMRDRWPEFRDQMDEVEASWRIGAPLVDMDLLRRRYQGVDEWKQLWLEKWRVSRSRIEACELVSRWWPEVEAELATDEAFAKLYALVQRELDVGVEDSLDRGAIAGRTSAQTARLEASMPDRYRKRVRVDHNHRIATPGGVAGEGAKKRWSEIYGRQPVALEASNTAMPQPQEEVIDGELVQA